MEGVGVVPRIVHHLGTTMVVGCHHEGDFSGKVHEPLGFSLIGMAVGMLATVWVGIIAVHVNAVGVFTGGAVHIVVSGMISTIGVGERANVEVDIVHHILHLRFVGVLQQIVDKAKHQDPACGFVTMDGGGVEELGLAVGCAVVEVGNQYFAVARERSQCDDFTLVGMVGLEIKHHGFVCFVGRVAVPIVLSTVAAIPHGDFFKH